MTATLRISILIQLCFALTAAAAEVPEDWGKVKSAALKAVRSDDAAVRHVAFEALRTQDHEEAAEVLVKALGSSRMEMMVRRHARDVLGSHRSEDSRDFVFGVLRSKPDRSFLLLEAFAAMGDERAPEIGAKAIQNVARDKDGAPVRAAAIRCLVASTEPPGGIVASIIGYTGDEHEIAIRRAAADALVALKMPAAVEALLELLNDPALKTRAHLLMVRIARKDLGTAKANWDSWWLSGGGAMPETEPIGEAEASELIAANALPAEELEEGVSFYGVPIEGKNVLFVLDASSSMRGYPLDRLKSECSSMVGELPETHRFALLFFPGNDCYPREMLAASAEVKTKAYAFIEKRKVITGTPVTKAMEYGFRRYVEGGKKIDAIYLLSDGAPSNPIPKVLAAIDDLNAGRYIPIHTIYIGKVPDPVPGQPAPEADAPPVGPIRTGLGFLKEVARRHDGKFSIVSL